MQDIIICLYEFCLWSAPFPSTCFLLTVTLLAMYYGSIRFSVTVLGSKWVTSPWPISYFQAKQIFESICPGEEFLPAIPNPEDIIRDDFLQNNEQSGNADGTVENQFQETGAAEAEESQEADGQPATAADSEQPGCVDSANFLAEQQATVHGADADSVQLGSEESANPHGDQHSVANGQQWENINWVTRGPDKRNPYWKIEKLVAEEIER